MSTEHMLNCHHISFTEIPVRSVPSVTFSIPVVQDPKSPFVRDPKRGINDPNSDGEDLNEFETGQSKARH